MSGFTPGPWVASLGEFMLTNSGQRAITTEAPDDAMPVHIAFVSSVIDRKRSTPYNAPDPVRDANARLIAAAPELLEAAENAMAYLGGQLDPSASEAYEALSAAIANATGEQP